MRWIVWIVCLGLAGSPTAADAHEREPFVPSDGRRPVIAVVANNEYTELTDFVVPYGVLKEAGFAEVVAVAIERGEVRFFPALRAVVETSLSDFDAQYPNGADFVIVPAMHDPEHDGLIAWLRAQADRGATIVGICDGGWVLGHAGLLDGHRATGHWFSRGKLARTFRDTVWIDDRRYVFDGHIATTTGVTASIPASLELVARVAGRERAESTARRLGINSFGPEHESDRYRLGGRHVVTGLWNWIRFWAREDVDLPLADAVDEIALALAADAYSRTLRSRAKAIGAAAGSVVSKRGLHIVPDEVDPRGGKPHTAISRPPTQALDYALADIARRWGEASARLVALQIEYQYDGGEVAPSGHGRMR